MEDNDLKKELENMKLPSFPKVQHKEELKLSILSTKKSSRLSFILLSVPAIILLGAICQSAFHILLPPWSWMVKYSHSMPLWLRISIYVTVLIVLPIAAAFLNILSLVWIRYDKEEKVLNLAIKLKTVNIIIITLTTVVALLFIGHTISEWFAKAK